MTWIGTKTERGSGAYICICGRAQRVIHYLPYFHTRRRKRKWAKIVPQDRKEHWRRITAMRQFVEAQPGRKRRWRGGCNDSQTRRK